MRQVRDEARNTQEPEATPTGKRKRQYEQDIHIYIYSPKRFLCLYLLVRPWWRLSKITLFRVVFLVASVIGSVALCECRAVLEV